MTAENMVEQQVIAHLGYFIFFLQSQILRQPTCALVNFRLLSLDPFQVKKLNTIISCFPEKYPGV